MCWPPKIGVFDSLVVLWFLAKLFGNHDFFSYCTSDGSIVSMAAGKDLPCDQDCNSPEGKISRYSGPTLPEVRHNGCM